MQINCLQWGAGWLANVMFEVEVVIALITFVVYFLNGSWRLGLRFKAAAKKLRDEGKMKFLGGSRQRWEALPCTGLRGVSSSFPGTLPVTRVTPWIFVTLAWEKPGIQTPAPAPLCSERCPCWSRGIPRLSSSVSSLLRDELTSFLPLPAATHSSP